MIRKDYLFLSISCFLYFINIFFPGCAGNQNTLNLADLPRPVFLSDRIASKTTIDTNLVQPLRSVSCYTTHEKESEKISEGRHVTGCSLAIYLLSPAAANITIEGKVVKLDQP